MKHWYKKHFGCNRSLKREFRWIMLFITLIVVIIYTVFLRSYFERGLDHATRTILMMEARAYQAEYVVKKDETPLPHTAYIKAYRNWDQLPELFKQYFPPNTHKHSQIQIEAGKHCGALALLPYEVDEGKMLYVTYQLPFSELTKADRIHFMSNFKDTLPLAIIVLLLTLGLTYFVGWRMSKPSQRLRHWANNLSLDDLKSCPPNFKYEKPNHIAKALHAAFQRLNTLVEREHYFLRHASHELRTPIAVIRANLSLLDKVGLKDKQRIPFDRLQRANKNMQLLTETLLWSSRETSPQINKQDTNLNTLVQEQIEDLSYLLEGKEIDLSIQAAADDPIICVAITPLQIVLANLIRNAFQHTNEGQVSIDITAEQITIRNRDEQSTPALQNKESFGLGLLLVQELCERLDWTFTIEGCESEVIATVSLY